MEAPDYRHSLTQARGSASEAGYRGQVHYGGHVAIVSGSVQCSRASVVAIVDVNAVRTAKKLDCTA